MTGVSSAITCQVSGSKSQTWRFEHRTIVLVLSKRLDYFSRCNSAKTWIPLT